MTTPVHHTKHALVIMALVLCCNVAQAQILYVNQAASGAANGSSWTDAYTDLQVAIDIAGIEDTIYVAAGTYLPTFRLHGDSLRNATFYIHKDILIFGGFSGEPGTEHDFIARDPEINTTILSGDLGIPGNAMDNAFHVVFIDHVSDTFHLDGFTVADGNGQDGAGLESTGTGIFIEATSGRSNPTIANCIIRDNYSFESGVGMLLFASAGKSNPTITNCQFINNNGSGGGGLSIYTDTDGEANPTIINCSFIGNTGRTSQGGAISIIAHSSTSSPRMINCIFTGNHSPTSQAISVFMTGTGHSITELYNCTLAGNSGGAIRMSNIGTDLTSKIVARNCIFWGNGGGPGISASNAESDVTFSDVQFFFVGEENSSSDPNFISLPAIPVDSAHTEGDVHIAEDSPSIDTGSNAAVPAGTTKDLDGLPRFINPFNGLAGKVDRGAYEVQESTSATTNLIPAAGWNVFPNPTHDNIVISFSETNVQGVLQLLDATGKILHGERTSFNSKAALHLDHLPAGLYYVHIVQQDGKHGTKALLVE